MKLKELLSAKLLIISHAWNECDIMHLTKVCTYNEKCSQLRI